MVMLAPVLDLDPRRFSLMPSERHGEHASALQSLTLCAA
jgi:hypothetical protein